MFGLLYLEHDCSESVAIRLQKLLVIVAGGESVDGSDCCSDVEQAWALCFLPDTLEVLVDLLVSRDRAVSLMSHVV